MNTKKPTKKLNKLKTSPLIAVIAVVEVIILVCACTFAWFVFSNNTTISTKLLSVEPDSGLEIDFSAASEDDYVVVNQYILDNFKFEPVTSTDGRNIFIPTTGTFANTVTENIAFREATVNDMNSKYICIDFTLTNTGDTDMPVFLSTRSTFKVSGKEGKALRLAFYQNDGSSGDIDSTYYQSNNEDDNVVTVYFRNTNGWDQPYAFAYAEDNTDINNMKKPGVPMTKISGDLYYYTFSTKYDVNGKKYDSPLKWIEFYGESNGESKGTYYRTIENNYIFTPPESDDQTVRPEKTLYTSSIIDGTYPIVSPGVSVGFQRQYAPVTNINNTSGSASAIVPAYANSIDNYSYGSTPLFTIEKRKTMSLSMIVWLEGTDPDCTGEIYSGKKIDLDLIFATSDNNDVQYSTYTFYDKTLETWISHETSSSTGANVKPVMQLYDNTIGKGYLMKELETFTDDEGKVRAKTWTVEAPNEIMSDNHDVVFRRVNPLDENEIWNYWDTTGASKNSATKIDGVEDTSALPDTIVDNYYFTALADGSPVEVKIDSNGNKTPNLPTYSCGGLWGKYETTQVQLYDGTNDQWIKDSTVDNRTGVVTMNYSYNGQNIEYKASGPNNIGLYTFVVPEVFIGNNADVSDDGVVIKRYYNFDTDYAINATEKQPDLTYHDSWALSYCKGHFIELNEPRSGDEIIYWGDDLLYVQVKDYVQKTDDAEFSTKFDSDTSHMQILYTSSDGEEFYSYIYKNDAVKGSHNIGYVSVVPSDKEYVNYRVERCNLSKPSEKYNATNKHPIISTAETGYYSNQLKENICALDHFKFTMYYDQTVTDSIPEFYSYYSGDKTNTEYTVKMSKDESTGLYYVDWNISLYDRFEIYEDVNGHETAYLLPSISWSEADPRYALYYIDSNSWADATEFGDTGIFYVDGVKQDTKVIWVRMNPATTENNWNDGTKWSQTEDLIFGTDYPIHRVNGWGKDDKETTIGNKFKSVNWGRDYRDKETYNGALYAFTGRENNSDSTLLELSRNTAPGVDKLESVQSTLYNNENDLW